MSSFKKAIRVTAVFLVLVLVLSVGLIAYYYHRGVYTYEDAKVRKNLAGQLDLLICGASGSQVSVNPDVLDAVLGTTSYNLGSPRLLLHARTTLLQKELARNPVKTVLLEVSLDILSQDEDATDYARGEARMLTRLDSFAERVDYCRTYIPAKNYVQLYAISLRYGLESLLARLTGATSKIFVPIRGYRENAVHDVTILPDQLEALHNSERLPPVRAENLAELQKMVDLCRAREVRVIVVITPTSDGFHWKLANEAESWDVLQDFCRRNGLTVLNFDLDRERRERFSEATSFSDDNHLCSEGAHVFSPLFAETVKRVLAGEDVSAMFYDSYAEMEADSPYAEP